MIRTIIFGAIAGIVGKKLYDEGKLQSFKDDLFERLDLNSGTAKSTSTPVAAGPAGNTGAAPSAPYSPVN